MDNSIFLPLIILLIVILLLLFFCHENLKNKLSLIRKKNNETEICVNNRKEEIDEVERRILPLKNEVDVLKENHYNLQLKIDELTKLLNESKVIS